MAVELISRFLVALAIGGLVGLEREIYQQKTKRGFAGIRTYLIVAFLGAMSALLMQVEGGSVFAYMVMGSVIALLVAAYFVSGSKGFHGMTTELSVVLVFVLSMLSTYPEYQKIAVILGVVLVVLLSLKEHLHRIARVTNKIEWNDSLVFVVMAFVILPLLPNQSYSIVGVADAFNPYRTWLMVVFVSGISFVGYFLTKVVKGGLGLGLAGMLGGLVSSTAVTESMASGSKKNPSLVNSYTFGAIAASVVMAGRVIFEAWVVESRMVTLHSAALFVMIAVGLVFALRWFERTAASDDNVDLNLGSPLSLKPALLFGLLFSVVVFLSKAMLAVGVGSYGFLALGLIAGMVDVDAITLSMSGLVSKGTVTDAVAWTTIVMAVVSNSFFKIMASRMFGSKRFFRRVGGALFVTAAIGILTLILYL
ncbi:MAG: DUF4010 domain-containing protein [Candidatus Dojkabacteria bacterium]|nr:DUF4010 domain-containing protein [Candidatus Dojkabacteria bacterium]